MNIKTITNTDGVNVVDFGSNASRFYWFKNLGATTVHVSANADITADADGVAELAAGDSVCIETLGGKVYVLGAGKVRIHNTGDKFCPFKIAPAVGGGVTGEGDTVVMDGLQGGVPFSEIAVGGKNLIGSNCETKSLNGIDFTVNADRSITLNGTSTAGTAYAIGSAKLTQGKKYRMSMAESPNGFNMHIGSDIRNQYDYTTASKTIIAQSNNNVIWLWVPNGTAIDNVTIYPQIEIGDTATDYEPPITGREITLNVCGKNLLNYTIPSKREYTVNNTTFTVNDDGSVTAVSSAAEAANTRLILPLFPIDGDFVFSGSPSPAFTTYIFDTTTKTVAAWANPDPVMCHLDGAHTYALYFMVSVGAKANGEICKPQLEIGSTATAYEPYHGSTVKITPNSNPYVVPNDIRQQDGHNVVSVSDGVLSVTGCKKNAALKRIWNKIDELTTAVIVSNGE